MPVKSGAASYWNSLASSYAALGSPLRPAREDIRFMEAAVAGWAAWHSRAPRAVLIGVTPDIAQMAWPAQTSLTAVDSSLTMVSALWPRNGSHCKRRLVVADWRALPLGRGACDIVIGDGSINCLPYPDGFRSLAAEISGVLGAEGLLVLRCYIQPELQEQPDQVLAELFTERIPSFHHFKFRLLMALQPSAHTGIAVNDAYEFWASSAVDEARLAARPGWEQAAIEMIRLYRGTDTVHTFPTRAELRAVLDESFDEVSVSIPSYCLGERCPTILFRPRQHTSELQSLRHL